ncbi:hypothetical protein [Kribbella sp. CA-293567]|uniref:hypothetical protein n=1 Tax=Kribbella sp. CA-293567 TaxID=3002436 RepID=UPI0022DD8C45|nr:hypothetical protein [Kribbella sp. CA-293567]WBQ02516.1 hypothetical protein OX958_21280 [Kribbella sp. CA-293567]
MSSGVVPDGVTSRVRGGLWAVIALAGVVIAVWVVTAARTVDHGFDITDEGYYLLSYRWWSSNPLALTGIQYIYGPVFQLLGWDIVGLRVFRLVTVVLAHAFFGWSFMRWLRVRRPEAPKTRIWEVAGVAAIAAAGGMCYSWLPLSPAYNDVVLLGSITVVSCVLWAAAAIEQDRKPPVWALVLAGLVIGVMVVAKWSSVVVIGLIVVAAIVVLSGQGVKAVGRGILWALAGVVVVAIVVHLFVVSLTVAVPGVLAVNRFIADTSYTPATLIQMYWTTSTELLGRTVKQHFSLLIAAAVAVVARKPVLRIPAWLLTAAGLAVSVYQALDKGGLQGGTANNGKFQVTLLAAVLVALITAVTALVTGQWSPGRENLRSWVILGLLAVLPFVQAFGTNTPPFMIGFNAFAAWAALMIAVLTSIGKAPAVARTTTAVVAAGALVAVAAISYGGLILNPYRSEPYSELTTATDLKPLGDLKVAPAKARRFDGLNNLLKPYTTPSGRPIIGFDKMAGTILVLRGRPFGEAWIAPRERQRTVAGIVEVCSGHQPRPDPRTPLLIFNRRVTQLDVEALRSCGLDFKTDYELVAPPSATMNLLVYVPAAELARQTP